MSTQNLVADRTVAADPFLADVQRAARRLLTAVPDLTARERDFIYRLHRYGFTAVQRVLEIAARAESRADAVAFPMALRGYTMRERARGQRDMESPLAVWHEETRAQAYADIAQSAALINPSNANRDAAIQHGTADVEYGLALIDSFQQSRVVRTPLFVLP